MATLNLDISINITKINCMKIPLKSQKIPVIQKIKNIFHALYKKQMLNINENENKNVAKDPTENTIKQLKWL